MIEPLEELVRKGKLASPIRRDFDRQLWEEARCRLPHSEATNRFFDSALWFADQLTAVHEGVAALKCERVDREALIRELCGRCNYAYVHSEARLRFAMLKAGPGDLPMGSPAHVLFQSATGDVGNADAWRTGSTDTFGAALRHVFAVGRRKRGPSVGAGRSADACFTLFNRLYVLEYYCEKAIWQDWCVERDGEAWRIAPPSPDPFGRSSIAVDWRRDQEHGEWYQVAGRAWRDERGFPELMADRKRPGDPFTVRLQLPGTGSIPNESVMRWMVTASDLGDVSAEPLPLFGALRVTLQDLIDAALLIGSAAKTVLNELMGLGPSARKKAFAPVLPLREIDTILKALRWASDKRTAVIDFFTYRGRAMDGLWSKPLVESEQGLIPILPAIVGPNLYRSAELWLAEAEGRQLQRQRGDAFEVRARSALREALGAAGLEDIVRIAPRFSIKIAGARQDVDIAIRIGRSIFIADAKLKRFPATPREKRRWTDELRNGAGQARERCEHFRKDPRAAAQATGFKGALADLRFIPFVLASGSFGAGVTIGDVPVIDFDSLKEFFNPGFFGVQGELQPDGDMKPIRMVPFRAGGLDLAMCLEAYLREPLRVRVIEAAMAPLARTIGIASVDGHEILCSEPMVDHRLFLESHADALETISSELWQRAVAAIRPGGAVPADYVRPPESI